MITRVFVAALLALICGCEIQSNSSVLSGLTMGTRFSITVIDAPRDFPFDAFEVTIRARLEEIEDLASTYRDSSAISKFNQAKTSDWINVAAEFCQMTESALQASIDTAGAFDITIGPLVELWGFGAQDAPALIPADTVIEKMLSHVGFDKVNTDCANNKMRKESAAVQLDLSAWAKGYAVDELWMQLSNTGLQNFIIEIGGEVRTRGQNQSRQNFVVAIERPTIPGSSSNAHVEMARIQASDVAVATSGNYRNFYERNGRRYGHTLDPRSGRPTSHRLAAVTVVNESAAYADALATAMLVMGPNDGLSFANEFELAAYFAVDEDGSLRYYSSAAFSSSRYLLNQDSM